MKRITTSFIVRIFGLTSSITYASESLSLRGVEAAASPVTTDMPLPDGSEMLHVDRDDLLSLRDFAHAKVGAGESRTVLSIELRAAGAKKLQAFTQSHVGQRLAVVLNDQLAEAPVIRVPITGPVFEIDAFSPKDAHALAQVSDPPRGKPRGLMGA